MGYQKGKTQEHQFLWDRAGGAGSNSSAATGSIPVFVPPANCYVESVEAQVLTAVTGSTAEEVGDSGDPDGWLKDNFAAATGVYPTSAEDVTLGVYGQATTAGATDAADVSNSREGKLYASAGSIDYKITGTATAGKIRFIVKFRQL